ncbi:GNAT family N-acetyltransferase [Phytoactinopolyspora halotolerans]|uniref:GNAT family N-acetyltransferase n=1 Tax=Phytoactinopolyspora halotolerans TaxID=1981512 RepID=A0A6L9SJL6_9ACTN|nr:GNAT family N-acetyltransferase [Phytoactinopolyspora halotolerans]
MRELARLKTERAQLDREPPRDVQVAFAKHLDDWIAAQGDALLCRVADIGGTLVGMAWMVVYERVPDLHDRHRLTGDIQSVFVTAKHRGLGIGAALIQALCQQADARGVRRVTVSANDLALPLYRSAGFSPSPHLLERHHPGRL